MILDHFNEPTVNFEVWAYYNMGSPCYQIPERVGDSEVRLYEYDRFNEGNCLISRSFLAEYSTVSAVVTAFEDIENGGACIGFYAGDGSFSQYVVLAAGPKRLEIRIPSGGQRGASFMDEGQPQQVALAGCDYVPHFPMKLELKREGTNYVAYLDGREVLIAQAFEIKGDARALVKALARLGERYTPKWTTFDSAGFAGIAPSASLTGTVLDASTGKGIAHASVHIAGFDKLYTLTDSLGRYELNGLPRGCSNVVVASEGYAFTSRDVQCTAGMPNTLDVTLEAETSDTIPRKEYHNPAFSRESGGFLSLNGSWQFQYDKHNVGEQDQWYREDAPVFDRVIRVPFSWASLMGFGEEHLADGNKTHEANTAHNNFNITGNYAWYRRSFVVPSTFPPDKHTLLKIGACSAVTNAWLDGEYLGMRVDEYGTLDFDMGKLLPGSKHTLTIKVEYPHQMAAHNMGKQIFWFSSAPGIWQSVWIEPRDPVHLKGFAMRPELLFEHGVVTSAVVRIDLSTTENHGLQARLTFMAPDGNKACDCLLDVSNGVASGEVNIENPKLWDYQEGNLYSVRCELLLKGKTVDCVDSYVGLRKVELRWLPGHSPEDTDDPMEQYQYVYLNDRPFYIIGILDQGYNAFGIYTHRSFREEAPYGNRGSIAYDIDRTLAYGYNMSRLHIKENEPLWYYECDRRGLPVWTEHPSNFFALPDNPDWQNAYCRELAGMLERLHNHPSILIVSTINESWGIEGRHVSSPWKNELRYRFMATIAESAKAAWPHVLVCDNSGFAKTHAGEINDYHYYPHEHGEARKRWEQLMEDCYPGSLHNHMNRKHGEGYVGNAIQSGKPILISEFLHINGIDMQTRMFEKIAGYLRMNLASHEVENSGPLTSDRYERDYGYVDSQMQSVSYAMVNSLDAVVPDMNRITRVRAGTSLTIDVYTSHFSHRTFRSPELCWTLTCIDALGRYVEDVASGQTPIPFRQYTVECHSIALDMPSNMRGAYLFLWLRDTETTICRNYVQLVFEHALLDLDKSIIQLPPSAYTKLEYQHYGGFYSLADQSLVWIAGAGSIEYSFNVHNAMSDSLLLMEVSAREGVGAIKVTDEIQFGTTITIYLNNLPIACISSKDEPSDERGLFTNNCFGGSPFNYRRLGAFGYGERFEVSIPGNLISPGKHKIRLECGEGGMCVYGAGTGRYGFNPCIVPVDLR